MLETLSRKISKFIETNINVKDRFFGGEDILKNRDLYEKYIKTDIMKDVDCLDDISKKVLFKYIVTTGITLPIPYTTNNFKKVHYFANEILNLANIFYQKEEKDIEFSFSSNEPIIKEFAKYIRSNNDEGAFVYRSSILRLPDTSIIHTEITKLDGMRGIFVSDYMTINVSPVSVDFTVKRLPFIE